MTTRQWNREATASGIEDAVRLSTLVVCEDSPLKIVPIPLLIALKLYAGGHKSKADIIELLVRNPDLEDGKKGTRSPFEPKPQSLTPFGCRARPHPKPQSFSDPRPGFPRREARLRN